MTFVETQPGDDLEFLAYVEAMIRRIAGLNVAGIYVTRIDGWFGERWVGFSGKTLGSAGVHVRGDFDIPPFVPNRVVSSIFLRRATEGYETADPPMKLHVRQRSEANLRRSIATLAPGEALVWFSSASHRDGRGSVLAYVPVGGHHEAWFLELARKDEWRVIRSVGVLPSEVSVAHHT